MLELVLLQAQSSQSSWMNIIMIVLIFVVFWLFLIRPQTKRQKEIQKFQNSLEKGTKVITSGGLMGVVQAVKDDHVVVEIAKGIEVKVAKNMVFASQDDANPQGGAKKEGEKKEEVKEKTPEEKAAAEKEEKKQKIVKYVLYGVVLVCAVVGFYFLSKSKQAPKEEATPATVEQVTTPQPTTDAVVTEGTETTTATATEEQTTEQ